VNEPTFRKSTHSGPESHCVEVAATDNAVLVRDSKHADGPVLTFDRPAWTAFLDAVRAGEMDGAA
jgi:hypothetical protein